jgi:hypothetical protein
VTKTLIINVVGGSGNSIHFVIPTIAHLVSKVFPVNPYLFTINAIKLVVGGKTFKEFIQ